MKKRLVYIVMIIVTLFGCIKEKREITELISIDTNNQSIDKVEEQREDEMIEESKKVDLYVEEVENLSFYEGRWLLIGEDKLNEEEYLIITKEENEYKAEFYLNERVTKGKLIIENNEVYIKAVEANYGLYKIRSGKYISNNGISLSLDEYNLANYQREEIVREVAKNWDWKKKVEK